MQVTFLRKKNVLPGSYAIGVENTKEPRKEVGALRRRDIVSRREYGNGS